MMTSRFCASILLSLYFKKQEVKLPLDCVVLWFCLQQGMFMRFLKPWKYALQPGQSVELRVSPNTDRVEYNSRN